MLGLLDPVLKLAIPVELGIVEELQLPATLQLPVETPPTQVPLAPKTADAIAKAAMSKTRRAFLKGDNTFRLGLKKT
jgi:hypothetical protein